MSDRRVQLGLAAAGLLLAALDALAVVTLLPQMLEAVELPIDHIEAAAPIVTGFLGGYVVAMPLLGAFSDARGRLPAYAAALAVFGVGSTLTALSPAIGWLVTGRVLQGLGGGALVPLSLALAADLYPTGQRGLAIGTVAAIQEAGSVLGPVYGASLAAGLGGWRSVFWLNLPLGALIMVGLWLSLQRGLAGGTAARSRTGAGCGGPVSRRSGQPGGQRQRDPIRRGGAASTCGFCLASVAAPKPARAAGASAPAGFRRLLADQPADRWSAHGGACGRANSRPRRLQPGHVAFRPAPYAVPPGGADRGAARRVARRPLGPAHERCSGPAAGRGGLPADVDLGSAGAERVRARGIGGAGRMRSGLRAGHRPAVDRRAGSDAGQRARHGEQPGGALADGRDGARAGIPDIGWPGKAANHPHA